MTILSRTSIWAAMARAVGSREPDSRVRNPDSLAELLIGPNEYAVLGNHPLAKAMEQPYERAVQNREVANAARLLISRTRFIDSRLEAAIHSGATQVVILGAGFDSRAYRLAELLAGTRVFEVDLHDIQKLKMLRVQNALGQLPENLTYVPADLRHDDLSEKLKNANYRQAQRTFVICEGITMYLPPRVVHGMLRWVATFSPPGSSLVFDYTYESTIAWIANLDKFPVTPEISQAVERFRHEPWIFGLPDGGEEQFLNSMGLRMRKTMGLNSPEAVKNYLTRGDGTIFGKSPGTERQRYRILEAVVPEPSQST